jgi:hypothetical protein
MRPEDPAYLTPDERARELARILSRGVLRLRDGGALPAPRDGLPAPENPSESSPNCLELSPPASVTVHTD